jgi:hypothetical protein
MSALRKSALALVALTPVAVGALLFWPRADRPRECESPAPSPAVAQAESQPPLAPSPETTPAAGVVRLAGSPEEIGAAHGRQLAAEIRTVIAEYVGDDLEDGRLRADMCARVRRMRASLPAWYRRELDACARAAKVNPDVLLYAQCEGDIKSLGGCTTYAAFGPATSDGELEIGRNFDYWGLQSTARCVRVFAVVPRRSDGHAFVSVGWSGILGGWTFYNQKGLFVANNLGGFSKRDPRGIPTLILERIVAQKAATLEEAIALVRKLPRMRGQVLIVGHAGDASRGVKPSAALVAYDAARVEVTRATDGLVFHSSIGRSAETILDGLSKEKRQAFDVIRSAGASITLHSVAIRPQEGKIWVAHGRESAAHLGAYIEHDMKALLRR